MRLEIAYGQWSQAEWDNFQRVVGSDIILQSTKEPVHVFASSWLLRNVLVHLGLCFQGKNVHAHLDVLMVNYQYASKVLGHPSGEYAVLTVSEEGFEYSRDKVLDLQSFPMTIRRKGLFRLSV